MNRKEFLQLYAGIVGGLSIPGLWDPTATEVFLYTQDEPDENACRGYRAGPRQYNPRIMD